MLLLHLPPEIFARIVYLLVKDIGPDRAWKHREVCRSFAVYIADDIFTNQTLESFGTVDYRVPKLLRANIGRFLHSRTKKLLDVNEALPSALNRTVNFVSQFESITDEQLRQTRREELGEQLRDAVIKQLSVYSILDFFTCGHPIGPLRGLVNNKEEQIAADNMAGAAAVGNNQAISACVDNGVPLWATSIILGNALTAAVVNDQQDSIMLIFRSFPQHIGRTTKGLGQMHNMLYEAIAAAFDNTKHATAIMLLDWLRTHMPALPKRKYNDLLTSAIRSQDQNAIEAVLGINVGKGLKVTFDHFERACRNDDVSTLHTLVNKGGFDVNRTCRNTSPLHYAIRFGCLEITRQLLVVGADANGPAALEARGQPKHLKQPLRAAVLSERFEVVALLLEYGATLAGHGVDNRPPLMEVSRKKGEDAPIYKLLLEAQAKEKLRV